MKVEEPLGSPEGSLDGWSDISTWHLMASLLASWAPPREWPYVSGIPDTVKKVLQRLERPWSSPVPMQLWAAMGWVFLSALRAEETTLCNAENYVNSKEKQKPWKPELVLWKKICQLQNSDTDSCLLLQGRTQSQRKMISMWNRIPERPTQ